MSVVMINEHRQDPFQVTRVEDQHPIEALGTHGSHQSFRDPVRLRCLDRCPHGPNASAVKHVIEAPRECAIAIPNQETNRLGARASVHVTEADGEPNVRRRTTREPTRRRRDAAEGIVTYHGFYNRPVLPAVKHPQLLENLKGATWWRSRPRTRDRDREVAVRATP